VRTVMSETGMAMMGTGTGRGENRARDAAEAAGARPLLEDGSLSGAHGLLVNVSGGARGRVSGVLTDGGSVEKNAVQNADVVVGCVIDPEMSEEIRVTVVATGIGRPEEQVQPQQDSRRMTAVTGGRAQPRHVPTLDDLSVPTYIRQQREHARGEIQVREHV